MLNVTAGCGVCLFFICLKYYNFIKLLQIVCWGRSVEMKDKPICNHLWLGQPSFSHFIRLHLYINSIILANTYFLLKQLWHPPGKYVLCVKGHRRIIFLEGQIKTKNIMKGLKIYPSIPFLIKLCIRNHILNTKIFNIIRIVIEKERVTCALKILI